MMSPGSIVSLESELGTVLPNRMHYYRKLVRDYRKLVRGRHASPLVAASGGDLQAQTLSADQPSDGVGAARRGAAVIELN